jgi:hypothetical protein
MNKYTIGYNLTPIKAQSRTSGSRFERMGRFQNRAPLLVAKSLAKNQNINTTPSYFCDLNNIRLRV